MPSFLKDTHGFWTFFYMTALKLFVSHRVIFQDGSHGSTHISGAGISVKGSLFRKSRNFNSLRYHISVTFAVLIFPFLRALMRSLETRVWRRGGIFGRHLGGGSVYHSSYDGNTGADNTQRRLQKIKQDEPRLELVKIEVGAKKEDSYTGSNAGTRTVRMTTTDSTLAPVR